MSKINRQGSNQILSSSVEYHNFVFLAGLTADDLSKDIKGQTAEVLAMVDAFDRRRKIAVAELNKIPNWVAPNPQGAFYVYSDVTGLLGREWGGKQINSSLELCDYILDAAEVALVPGEAFGPSGYVRLSYALGDAPLLEGIQRLQKLFA